jgi:hypothetical protein
MQTEKLKQFFLKHPTIDIVYVALGVLFQDIEKAKAYLGGVIGKQVEIFTRKQSDEGVVSEGTPAPPITDEEEAAKLAELSESQNALSSEQVKEAMDKNHGGTVDEQGKKIS